MGAINVEIHLRNFRQIELAVSKVRQSKEYTQTTSERVIVSISVSVQVSIDA